MSTLRTTTLKHGSSTIDNIVFDNQGRSTFGNDALFVNAQTQRVGVNTTSPTVALDVDGAINSTGNVTFGGQLNLTGNLTVDTNTLFVDATNNRVGINTASPASALDVVGVIRSTNSASAGYYFRGFRSTSTSAFYVYDDGTDIQLTVQPAGALQFRTENAERMRISSTGNVGVNATAPEAKLTINPGNAGSTAIGGRSISYGANLISTSGRSGFLVRNSNNFTSDNDNSAFQWIYPFDSGGDDDYKVFRSSTGASLVNRFWVNQVGGGYFAGNVGIGVDNPQGKLHTFTGASAATANANADDLILESSGSVGISLLQPNNRNARITFGDPQDAQAGMIFYDHVADDMTFTANSNERMRIDSTGRVLIGYSKNVSQGGFTPTLQQHANSASGTGIYRWSNNGGAAVIGLAKSRGTAPGINAIVLDGDPLGALAFSGDNGTDLNTQAASITANVDGTPGTNNMPGRLVFSTTADGASSPTERMRISNNGNIGINTTAINNNDNLSVGAIVNNEAAQRYISVRGKTGSAASNVSGFACLGWSGHDAASPYTTNSVIAYSAQSYTPGTNQTLTNLYGFHASPGLTDATNNYGFHSNLAAGTGRWNFYANGTAANYFAGRAGVGTEASNLVNVDDEGVVLQPTGQIYINPGTNQACIEARRNNDGFLARFFNNSTTPCGDITVTGQTTAFNTSSDYRLKENITPIVDAADRVKALKPCRFNFIADASKTVDGFLAHEAQEVVPEAVTGTKDGEEMQAIDTSKLVPLLTAALQEALERIKVLEQRVLE